MKDWRNDPEAHREWEWRYRQVIIVPVPAQIERPPFEPALWVNIAPRKRNQEPN